MKKINYGSVLIHIVLFLIAMFTLMPFLHVISMSISDPIEVIHRNVNIFPKGFSLKAYEIVFNEAGIWRAYMNSIIYTVSGTVLNVFLALITAYPLSRKDFILRKYFMIFLVTTIFFSGGMVPLFILITKLKLYDSMLAVILPSAMSVFNVILVTAYMNSLTDSYRDAAYIDGANDLQVLFRIITPLCKPILAVTGLFSAVSFWNSYFPAMLYISDSAKHPVTIYLIKLVINRSIDLTSNLEGGHYLKQLYSLQVMYSAMIVVIIPIVCVYPFLQKHFAKGILFGSVKE